MSAILLSTVSVYGMKNNAQLALQAEKYEKYEKYNDTVCLLTSLPNEKLIDIFSFCLVDDDMSVVLRRAQDDRAKSEDQVTSLENSIKSFMNMSMACRNFNRLLTFKTIGELCESYTQKDKKNALQNILRTINEFNCQTRRLPILVLVTAGAQNKTKNWWNSLLYKAILYKNIELASIAFRCDANPNIINPFGDPVLFDVKTVEMAQLFIDNNVHLNDAVSNDDKTNILWYLTGDQHPADLMELYLTHGADAKTLRPCDNFCLLHQIAKSHPFFELVSVKDSMNDPDNFLQKGILLLNAIPDMINTLDINNQTPLDVAQETLEELMLYGEPGTDLEKLIILFKKCGGITAQELKK